MRAFRAGRPPRAETDGQVGVGSSQIVAQLMFVEEDGDLVHLDAVALCVNGNVGQALTGSPFTVRCVPPRDPIWGPLLVQLLRRWAARAEVVGIDFSWKRRPTVVLRSPQSTLQLDLVS